MIIVLQAETAVTTMSLGYKICMYGSYSVAGILALVASYLLILNQFFRSAEIMKKRHVHGRAWIRLAREHKRNLPRKAIKWILSVKKSVDELSQIKLRLAILLRIISYKQFVMLSKNEPALELINILMLVPLPLLLGSIAFWINYGRSGVALTTIYWIAIVSSIILILYFSWGKVQKAIRAEQANLLGCIFMIGALLGAAAMYIGFPMLWIEFTLGLSSPICLILLICTSIVLFIQFGALGDFVQEQLFRLGTSSFQTGWVAISLPVTVLAFWLGSLFSPVSPLPQNMQMLLVNVVCDALTLYFTFKILEAAVADKPKFTILTAVLIDIWVAIILACLSLWLGTFQWGNYMGFKEMIMALVGRNAAGTAWEFGPYFWAMHTTFIPTLIYLGAILVLYVARMVVKMRGCWLWRLRINIHPYALTAAVLGSFAVFFVFVGKVLEYWHKF